MVRFDLEERTKKYGKEVISFVGKIHLNVVNKIIISQLVRSATSIGANYCEADDAYSKKDFVHKLALCRKESRETKHWLEMLKESGPNFEGEILKFLQEAQELNLIFSAIINRCRGNNK
jgi:four helix bundle protein